MIHISLNTKILLPEDRYEVLNRGTVKVKGKGEMETFYIFEKGSEIPEELRKEN